MGTKVTKQILKVRQRIKYLLKRKKLTTASPEELITVPLSSPCGLSL